MATEGMNITEEAEMAECDGDKVVTMVDVLEEQQNFEEDANAVLGASDDKNCTYVKGYIKRQAIYACLTCCPDVKTDPTKRAGVCLACSLNCHENHELVELYTKRNFRCDCGNPKFTSKPCQFTPSKPDLNNDNIYNQNFSGLYCTCQRPYPDPEATFDEDDMIQCIICEDWLHASHLEAVVPANDQYSEMICKACMNKNDFLHDYSNLAVNVEIVDIVTVNGDVAKAITNTEDKMLILNGDVNMADEKETNSAKNESSAKDNDSTPQDQTKPSEEEETKPTEAALEDRTKTDDIHTDNENPEPDFTETKETAENANKDDSKEVQKENEIASDATTDDKMEGTNENSDTTNEQREKDEQSTSDVNTDKNETEVAANIKISDKPSEESSTVEETENDDVKKSVECLEKVEDSISPDNSNDKSEASLTDQTNDGSDAKSELESGNIEVDKSQESLAKNNVDDKTDAVMDAIDALLESDTVAKDSESKETRDELQANEVTQETNDAEMCEKQTKENEPESIESSTADSNKKTDGDVEMTDNSSQNEPSENENKVNNEVQDDSENKVNNEVQDDSENKVNNEVQDDSEKNESNIVDSTETTDSNKTTDESLIDTVEKSIVSDKFVNGDVNEALNETDNTSKVETDGNKNGEDNASNTTGSTNENKRKLSITEESSPKKVKLDSSKCERPKGVKKVYKGATFWPSNFRQKLCTCGECISMYKSLNVLFLTDLEDTVSFYESLGKANIDGIASQYEKGLQALSSLDRIQQINALTEYNKMRDKLLDFLKSFKDRKEVVKEEDIKAFFADMKPRREPDGVYFCR